MIRVQVFADVVCPWCWLASVRLERVAATWTLRTGEAVEVVHRAFQLDPDAPSDRMPALDALAERLGGREQADEATRRLLEAVRPDGLVLDLASAVRVNTFDAHRLLSWAVAAGGPGAQRDLAHELWRAHFAEGADVADHTTLAARAAAVGLDADAADALLASDDAAAEVRLQLRTAAQAGITTPPAVVLDNAYAIVGAQPEETYVRALDHVVAQREA